MKRSKLKKTLFLFNIFVCYISFHQNFNMVGYCYYYLLSESLFFSLIHNMQKNSNKYTLSC